MKESEEGVADSLGSFPFRMLVMVFSLLLLGGVQRPRVTSYGGGAVATGGDKRERDNTLGIQSFGLVCGARILSISCTRCGEGTSFGRLRRYGARGILTRRRAGEAAESPNRCCFLAVGFVDGSAVEYRLPVIVHVMLQLGSGAMCKECFELSGKICVSMTVLGLRPETIEIANFKAQFAQAFIPGVIVVVLVRCWQNRRCVEMLLVGLPELGLMSPEKFDEPGEEVVIIEVAEGVRMKCPSLFADKIGFPRLGEETAEESGPSNFVLCAERKGLGDVWVMAGCAAGGLFVVEEPIYHGCYHRRTK